MSKAYWILPDSEIIDIGIVHTHISYIIAHPARFNITKEKIIDRYNKYNEVIPVEGIARKQIIMDLLNQNYIRIRQYKNHWAISLFVLDEITKKRLSKWADLTMTIPNSDKYADVIIQTYGAKKHHYSVEDLFSESY
jgi:hypothetical protein